MSVGASKEASFLSRQGGWPGGREKANQQIRISSHVTHSITAIGLAAKSLRGAGDGVEAALAGAIRVGAGVGRLILHTGAYSPVRLPFPLPAADATIAAAFGLSMRRRT